MPRPDPLARSLVHAALELRSHPIWSRVRPDSPFVVLFHIPDEDDAHLSAVLEVPERSLAFMRADAFSELCNPSGSGLPAEGWYVDYAALRDIPVFLRAPLEAAGFRGRREHLAPVFGVRRLDDDDDEHEDVAPRRREMRLLTWCLRGLLGVSDLDEVNPHGPSVPVLVLSGAYRAPKVVVHQVPWPRADDPEDVTEDPQTLAEWKAVENEFTARLYAEAEKLVTPRALARYFGSEDEAEEMLDEFAHLCSHAAFFEWLVADYRPTKRSSTYLEKRLRNLSASRLERALIQARRDAQVSFYRIESCTPGETLDLEDVLTGERVVVHDASLSACGLDSRHVLPLRLVRAGEWLFPAFAGPPVSCMAADRLFAYLESEGLELTPEGLLRDAHLVGRCWVWTLEERDRRPILTNTDDEALELHVATLQAADIDAAVAGLRAREDVHYDEEDGSWVWDRPGSPLGGQQEGNTVLGRIEVFDDRLVLEVNSAERLATARGWLEALPGRVRVESVTQRVEPELDDQLPGPPPEPAEAEMRAAVEQMLLDRYLAWVDEPVPALGGLTPRAACATEEGRRRVERLVRTMPAAVVPGGEIAPPRAEVMRELGLGRKGE